MRRKNSQTHLVPVVNFNLTATYIAHGYPGLHLLTSLTPEVKSVTQQHALNRYFSLSHTHIYTPKQERHKDAPDKVFLVTYLLGRHIVGEWTGRRKAFGVQLGRFSLLQETSQPAQRSKPADLAQYSCYYEATAATYFKVLKIELLLFLF